MLLEVENEVLRRENLRLQGVLRRWAAQGLVPVDEALQLLSTLLPPSAPPPHPAGGAGLPPFA